ncbi:MAG TPA: hypothetical protein VMU70_01155 [Candidatus Tyrphobacter sp.]|nr:hypothetical protein [Candidatus Tyrphobacter sp.]
MKVSTLAQKGIGVKILAGLTIFLFLTLIFGLGYIFGRDWTPTPILIEKR